MFSVVPQSVALVLGPVTIYWYGLCIAAGAAAGFFILLHLWRQRLWPIDEAYSLFVWTIIVGFIGARLYYVLYAWQYFQYNLNEIWQVWHGGLAIHGGLIGGLLVIGTYAYRQRRSLLELLDVIVVGIPLGQAIGRWGNYFNQELFGTPTNLPWGIPIDVAHRPLEYVSFTHFHPTFLYESILNFILFLILLSLNQKKPQTGALTAAYFFGYGLIRFMMEFWRTYFSPLVFGIRWAQLFSVGIMLVVVGLVVYGRYGRKSNQ